MSRINHFSNLVLSVILIISISLMNANIVLADDGSSTPESTPFIIETVTSESTPTVEPVEATTESTIIETPSPEAISISENASATGDELATETPISTEQSPTEEEVADKTLLDQVPEDVEVIVLDKNGGEVPLASQEALDIMLEMDPMWCPVGVLPGGAGCTTNFSSINNLLTDMRNNTGNYTQDGTIYFTATAGGSFSLTTAGSSLGTGDYNTLKGYNLTLQGGWNGANGASATFTGQTNFGNNTLTVGTSANPWVGNITLNNFTFGNVTSGNAITIYTTSGDVKLDNVDVSQQRGDDYTAYINSQSGDITVQNGSSFDGNNSGGSNNRNKGFYANTNTGAITITDTTFTDSRTCSNFGFFCVDATANSNGATLSAPIVTLTNVIASNNDLSGIQISNATSIWLNNVVATNNGTFIIIVGLGSGVNVDGTGSTVVTVNGGTLSNNEAYGLSVSNGSISAPANPTCSGNTYPGPDPSQCYNILPSDTTPPVLTLPANITVEATGPSGTAVAFSPTASDAVDGAVVVTCSPSSGSTFALGTTAVNCSASDSSSNTVNGSFNVTVQDTTDPTLTLPADITSEATGPSGTIVNYAVSATDAVDVSVSIVCDISSGSTFTIGTALVTCTATDNASNSVSGSFNVTIQDTTAPTIAPQADIILKASGKPWEQVKFSLTTSDIVDGAGIAICSPTSGSTFLVGKTLVTCNATDANGNQAIPVSFYIYISYNNAPTVPSTGFGGSIPVTGGELINLACLSNVNAFGIKLTFYNLCEHQTVITQIDPHTLPSKIPDGYSFVKGLNVTILFDNQVVKDLPKDSGIQMDYPSPATLQGDYTVFFWYDNNNGGGKWFEVTQMTKSSELDKIMSADAEDELYKIEPTDASKEFFQIITTKKTGTFILVKK